MNRQEAITYLNVIWNRYRAEYEIERETLDAFDMAIEALEQIESGRYIKGECSICSKEYGTLGCCTTVSNHWVYSCKEGMTQYIEALSPDAVQGGGAEVRDDRTYINEPYMQQSRHDDGRMTREQAVKWVKFVHDVLYEDKDEEIREALNMAIEALKDDWTPVSEGLPEVGRSVLISDGVWTAEGCYRADGLWHQFRWDCQKDDVIAWRPLPEPYRESEE